MRIISAAFLVLLTGCTTYDDLLATATSCGNGPECDEIWETVNKRLASIERREERDRNPCPQGYAYVKDSLRGNFCVSSSDLRNVFR